MREGSFVLEAALRQMDDVLKGKKNDVRQLSNDLREALQVSSSGECMPDVETIRYLATWARGHLSRIGMDEGCDCNEVGSIHQTIHKLETEKEQLALQVNVMNAQIEAQNEKILEVENLMFEAEEQRRNSEALLKKEMAARTTLESSRLDLVAQISAARLLLSQVEGEKRAFEERCAKLESELILTCACLADKEADLATLKSKLSRNGAVTPKFECNSEMDKLRGALTSVISVNDEKEKTIQEMQTSLNRYKRLHELVLSNPSRRQGSFSKSMNEDSLHSTLDSITSSEFEDISSLSTVLSDKPPPVPRLTDDLRRPHSRSGDLLSTSPLFSPVRCSSPQSFSPPPTPQKTPPSKRHYSTLPRLHQTEESQTNLSTPVSAAPEHMLSEQNTFDRRTSSPHIPREKARGLRKIFGKVKRTGSESLQPNQAELKRGGIRATAGPRLGWIPPKRMSFKTDLPLSQWDITMVVDWLSALGLGVYVPYAKKWLRNGEQLLKSNLSDFEKELHIKNPMHRKKLLLALTADKEEEGPARLDPEWVVRWLDDIGLPHYKDHFSSALVDGRMLHHLTLEDLNSLKVNNHLHVLSIKTGIRVLRENKFRPHCLLRRPLPDDVNTPEEVGRWTNHRVMEWLRSVDLSEYAPNLRGSGVHGGLMLYEPGFNADLLACLLNIPPSKTLLRRHLTTQFRSLIGGEVQQQKREWEVHGTPLSPSTKMKITKKSSFSIVKKKHKNGVDPEDYVCPLTNADDLTERSLLNRTEEEKFLMKEMALKKEKLMESMPASNV